MYYKLSSVQSYFNFTNDINFFKNMVSISNLAFSNYVLSKKNKFIWQAQNLGFCFKRFHSSIRVGLTTSCSFFDLVLVTWASSSHAWYQRSSACNISELELLVIVGCSPSHDPSWMKLSSELEQKVEGEFPNKILDVSFISISSTCWVLPW